MSKVVSKPCVFARSDEVKVHPLAKAIQNGNLEEVLELIGQEADGANTVIAGLPLVILAIKHQKPEVLALLIEHGASVNKQDDNGNTALDWVSSYPNPEVVAILVKSGVDLRELVKQPAVVLCDAK